MREILYRGKRKDNGEWVYGFILNDAHTLIGYYKNSHDFCIIEVIPETVGQYTGGGDKNGDKIFAGDIVKIYWKENTATIGFIKYVNCLYRFTIVENGVPYGFDDTTTLEVIGNIYDNKNLLEEKL